MKKIAIFLVALLVFSLTAVAASAASVNVALNKSYTVEVLSGENEPYGYEEEGGGYGDGPNGIHQRLTNGEKAPIDNGGSGLIGAQNGGEVDIVIDLGKVTSGINKLTMDLFAGNYGITQPDSVEYFISDDKENFTSLGVVELTEDNQVNAETWLTWIMDLELETAVSARYVKVKVLGGSHVWTSEIEVFAEEAGTSDPTETDPTETEPAPKTSDATLFIGIALLVSAFGAAVVLKKTRA